MYQNIHKLPLTVFIDILTTRDYSLLITQGHATEEQLLTQWEVLYTEYIEAITGKEMLAKMATVKDSILLQNKIDAGRVIIELISEVQNDRLFELLYDFNYPLPAYTGTNHEAVINTFIAYYKSDYMDLQLLASVENESNEEITIDYDYFMSTIADMNIGMKTSLDINTITVGAYCAYVQKYRQYCKSMSKKQITDND